MFASKFCPLGGTVHFFNFFNLFNWIYVFSYIIGFSWLTSLVPKVKGKMNLIPDTLNDTSFLLEVEGLKD